LEQVISNQAAALIGLLKATSLGDRAAFRRLYDATAPKLFGIVLRITSNRSVAEEVLQETYIRVWQNAERYMPEAGQPFAWLAAIARNRAIDRLRSERVNRLQDLGEDNVLERLAAPAGEDVASRESLRVCLSELDEESRNCVVLAY
jgi:RNA polymerase sigma factor (sigma-70 family)